MKIHTFEASSLLNNERYYNIQEDLKADYKWESHKEAMTYFGLSEKGIIIQMSRIKNKGFFTYSIIYRISAHRVLNNGDYIGLFDTKDYNELEEVTNSILSSKSTLLPLLHDCCLRRVDFCVNAFLDNQKQVESYIKTVQRGNVPKSLLRKTYYNKRSKRVIPTKNEMAVTCSDFELSIYNKYRQMKAEKYKYPDSQVRMAKSIVRIELRCKKAKINSLSKKFDTRTIKGFMKKADEIGMYLYGYYLTKMFGSGDFYSLQNTISRIKMSDYPKNTRLKMIDFAKDITQTRSATVTIRTMKKNQTLKLIDRFDEIDTNYVTAVKSDADNFKDGCIPALLVLCMEHLQ